MKGINEAQIILLQTLNRNEVPELKDFNNYLKGADSVERTQELAFYIDELSREGYIRLTNRTYITGGSKHPVYKNNVRMISLESIILLPLGKEAIQNGLFNIINDKKITMQEMLAEYNEVTVSVILLPNREVKFGPVKSDFFFEEDGLVILKIKQKIMKSVFEDTPYLQSSFEILTRYDNQPAIMTLEFE